MIALQVYRGPGDRPGPDISDPLIGSPAIALARGRAEMDARAHPRLSVRRTIPHRPGLALGLLVRVADPLTGAGRVERITGIRHRLQGAALLTDLTLDFPLP